MEPIRNTADDGFTAIGPQKGEKKNDRRRRTRTEDRYIYKLSPRLGSSPLFSRSSEKCTARVSRFCCSGDVRRRFRYLVRSVILI